MHHDHSTVNCSCFDFLPFFCVFLHGLCQSIPQFGIQCGYLWLVSEECASRGESCPIVSVVLISLCLTVISLFVGILHIIIQFVVNQISTHEETFEHEIKFSGNLMIKCRHLNTKHKYSFSSISSSFENVFESCDEKQHWAGRSDVYYEFEVYSIEYISKSHQLNVFFELTTLTMTANLNTILKNMTNVLNQFDTNKYQRTQICKQFRQSLKQNLKISKRNKISAQYVRQLYIKQTKLQSHGEGERDRESVSVLIPPGSPTPLNFSNRTSFDSRSGGTADRPRLNNDNCKIDDKMQQMQQLEHIQVRTPSGSDNIVIKGLLPGRNNWQRNAQQLGQVLKDQEMEVEMRMKTQQDRETEGAVNAQWVAHNVNYDQIGEAHHAHVDNQHKAVYED